MNRYFISFLLLMVFCTTTLAQQSPFAVINDPDGYTNLRLGEDRKIADKIYANQVFVVYSIVDQDGWQDWFWAKYPDYALQKNSFEKFINKTKEGMIHKSRIHYLPDLPQWEKEIKSKDSLLICKSTDARLEIRYGKFDPKKHQISYDQKNIIEKIDGKQPWGIDGALLPNLTEIKSITLIQNDKKYSFPKEAIQNIFQPTTEAPYFGVAVGTDNHLFLYMSNSDGAGSYEVVWTIKNGEVFNQFLYRNF